MVKGKSYQVQKTRRFTYQLQGRASRGLAFSAPSFSRPSGNPYSQIGDARVDLEQSDSNNHFARGKIHNISNTSARCFVLSRDGGAWESADYEIPVRMDEGSLRNLRRQHGKGAATCVGNTT